MFKYFKVLRKEAVIKCIIGLFAFILFILPVHAEHNSMIQVLAEQEAIYSKEDTVTVHVNFLDMELYNEYIYLAYHVKDLNGNILRYESERYPVLVDGSGSATIDVRVNLNDIESKEKMFTLEFDLVDEKAGYWFSDIEHIDFDTLTMRCELKGVNRVINLMKKEVLDSPIVFGVNLFMCVCMCVCAIIWKKNINQRV